MHLSLDQCKCFYRLFCTRFDYWTYGGVLHIVDFDLIGEDEDRPGFGGRVRIDGDGIAAPGEDEDFRRYLHARHGKVDPWEVASKTAGELEGFDLDKHIAELPSYLALRSFLDGHVPDGEDDYFFANRVLAELVDMVRDECEPGEIVGSMQEWGIGFDSEAQVNKVLELMMNLANDIPIRSNNGWSPNQMLQREMAGKEAKRVFCDASGKPRKVGRNEPCPCGSRKKYKRCCGR